MYIGKSLLEKNCKNIVILSRCLNQQSMNNEAPESDRC